MDFETTGAVPGLENEPWQIGLVEVAGGRVCPETAFESWLRVAPDRPFNPHAPGRHGQVRDLLAVAPSLAELCDDLSDRFAGAALTAHNVGTERTMLRKAMPLHAFGPWVDTLKLARRFLPGLPGGSLETVADALGLRARIDALCPGRAWHDALYDAMACAALLEYFLGLPGWESVPLQALL